MNWRCRVCRPDLALVAAAGLLVACASGNPNSDGDAASMELISGAYSGRAGTSAVLSETEENEVAELITSLVESGECVPPASDSRQDLGGVHLANLPESVEVLDSAYVVSGSVWLFRDDEEPCVASGDGPDLTTRVAELAAEYFPDDEVALLRVKER